MENICMYNQTNQWKIYLKTTFFLIILARCDSGVSLEKSSVYLESSEDVDSSKEEIDEGFQEVATRSSSGN
ncbi:hypothetical protein V6N12_005853 [Hibiscus sabdariffa]|uniref:Uncharacterized protein n=1 Tax=Hibiscus sabdariffa TaxID=183260 RepID=A0ABR2EWE2_9ROSI